MMRRGFVSKRRRAPMLLGASYGFLRPPRRHEDELENLVNRLREDAGLRREYRTSLAVQLTVVGALLVAVLGLVIETIVVVRRARVGFLGASGWMLPVVVGFLALLVARRFLRLWDDYRRLGDD